MDALTILIGVAILYVISGLIRKRRQNLPPGPLGLPFFGNIFQLDRKKPFKTFTSWIPKYGDIFCVRMLKTDVVVVNSYELIFESLFTKGEDFASRPYSLRNNLVVGLVNNIAFAPYSEKFIFMKRLAAQAIRVHAIAPLEETSRDIIREMINGMQKFVHDGSALDLSPCLHRCIAAIIMSMMYACHPTKEDVDNVLDIQKDTIEVLSPNGPGVELDIFPWLRFFPNKTYDKAVRVYERNLEWFPPKHELRKMNRFPGDPACMVDAFCDDQENYKDENGETLLSDSDILGISMDMIRAGTITSSVTLNALMVILVNNPDVQKKMSAEIHKTLGSRIPRLADMGSLPYTEAVILEMYRYSSIAPLGVPRCTTVDTKLAGYDIPKGTKVMMNLYNLHHDERYWEDPWEFRPERFLTEDGEVVPLNHIKRMRLMPFMGGRRGCVAETFARHRIFLIVVSLLQAFHFLPEEDAKMPLSDPRTYEFGIVTCPQRYKVRLAWA